MALPASIQEIADVIGREDALHLIDKVPKFDYKRPGKGWQRTILYVPKRLSPNHRLVEILGEEKARKLVAEFGGEILTPANGNEVKREKRNEEVRRLATGEPPLSPREIAEIVGITARHVRNIIRSEIPPEDLRAANDDACSHARSNRDCGTGR